MLKLVTDSRKFTFTSQDDIKAISDALEFIDKLPNKQISTYGELYAVMPILRVKPTSDFPFV